MILSLSTNTCVDRSPTVYLEETIDRGALVQYVHKGWRNFVGIWSSRIIRHVLYAEEVMSDSKINVTQWKNFLSDTWHFKTHTGVTRILNILCDEFRIFYVI